MGEPNKFVFNGESSTDYGLYITVPGAFSAPQRALDVQRVPGRNGEIVIDKGYYENRVITYKTWLDVPNASNRGAWSRRLSAWLLSNPAKYCELYDSYDPDFCKLAHYSGGIDMDAADVPLLQQTLTFSCKPFQYLRAGLVQREIKSGVTLVNPCKFAAKPYLRITGSGDVSLTVGNSTWKFSSVDGYIEIDSERMSTYKDTQLLNSHKSGPTGYPQLSDRHTGISWSGAVSKVEIIPRWCTL